MASEERCSLDIGEMVAWMGMDGCCRCDVFDCQDIYERCFLFGVFVVLVGWRKVEGER